MSVAATTCRALTAHQRANDPDALEGINTMEAMLAIAAIVVIVAIFGALATLYGEESRVGFAPYGNGA
jgi:hypothetical protein